MKCQPTLILLMAQINPTVGAVASNTEKILRIIEQNQSHHDIIIFPELALTGYPPEDLLFREELYHQVFLGLKKIQNLTRDCLVIVGHPTFENGHHYNAASLFKNGERLSCRHKQNLPNYGVFDEIRYFSQGSQSPWILPIKGYHLGLCICEDLWQPGPVDALIKAGADTLICINASPFESDKQEKREALIKQYTAQGLIIFYVNQVGGQDELVFDGQSMALDQQGVICARAPAFRESLLTVTLLDRKIIGKITPLLTREALIYQALICGLRDYVEKNGFPGVLLGLSGGIDSALTLAIAVDALGPSRVHAILMPSRYTAAISLEDALKQTETMQVRETTLPIEPAFNSLITTLSPAFEGNPKNITEENIQARIRGVLLMALSNQHGSMVITTSNKSETAVGYTTLYGDMVGGYAVLKDVLKTQVYQLARYRNSLSPVIPERVITRPPSAELAENQVDQDHLPEYETLDAVIQLYMERHFSDLEIAELGYDLALVQRIIALITRNEYKRAQAPPGTKISSRAFGRDWRYPITSKFHR